MDIRRFGAAVPLAALHAQAHHARSTRPTTTSSTRATSARPGGRCGCRAPTPGTASTARRSARSRAGSASTGTRPTRPTGDEALRPRGWAGRYWSPAIGAEHVAVPRARRRCSTSRRSRRSRSPGRARPAFLESLCDNRVARDVGRDHLHADAQRARRDRVRLHGHARGGGAASRSSPARRSATTTCRGSAATRPPTARVRVSDVTARWACFALWGPRARDVLAPLTPDPLDFGYMTHARPRRRRRAGARAARDLRRASWAGSSTARPSTAPALWRALWEAGEPHGLVAGGYRAIDTLRLEKGYRVWAADITPDETPYEAGLGLLRASDDKEFVGARRAARARAGQAPALPRPGRPALGRAGQRAGARRRRGRRAA